METVKTVSRHGLKPGVNKKDFGPGLLRVKKLKPLSDDRN
jgi:hypothetical protein